MVTTATALPVDDPFEQAIEVDFIPLFDPTTTRMVFIDVRYDDPDNDYRREERLTLQGIATDPVHLRISLLDPSRCTFRYRLTFVGTNNQMRRGEFIETDETLISVSENTGEGGPVVPGPGGPAPGGPGPGVPGPGEPGPVEPPPGGPVAGGPVP